MNLFDFYRNSNQSHLIQLCPAAILLNGRNFSRLNYRSDFDEKFHSIMEDCAKFMMDCVEANFAWIHQDKILFLFKDSLRNNFSTIFDGSVADLNLRTASICSSYFNLVNKPKEPDQLSIFNCQSWNLPTVGQAIEYISYLEQVTARNSIYKLGEIIVGKEVYQQQLTEVISKILDTGNNWEDLNPAFKTGTWIQRSNDEFNYFSMPLMEIENKKEFIFEGQRPNKIVREVPEGV